MKNIFLALALSLSIFGMTACNAYNTAVGFSNVISGLLTIGSAEVPQVPAADQASFSNFITLGQTLDAQLNSCLSAANSGMNKSSKFLACFNNFAQGITAPAEMTQLRLLSDSTRHKVQLYVTAATVAVNVGIKYFGGAQVTTPTVTSSLPTRDELAALAAEAHITPAEFAMAY
jgi:hypothetical protein